MSFAIARSQKNTKLCHNRPGETENRTNLHLDPYDYFIYYVNVDLRHQYGISVTEAQASLMAKRPWRREAMRDGCIPRLIDLWSKRQENLNVCFSLVQKTVDRKTRFHDKFEIRKADENRSDKTDRNWKRK